MINKLPRSLFLFLCLAVCFSVTAQVPPKEPAKSIAVPAGPKQAKEVFEKAWHLENEQQLSVALSHYKAVLEYYYKNKQDQYTIITLSNMGSVYSRLGEMDKALLSFQQALELAIKTSNMKKSAELHHKMGVIFTHLAKVKEYKEQNPDIIYPDVKNKEERKNLDLTTGTYTQLVQVGKQFTANHINLGNNENPYETIRKLYTKVINLKVKGDFEPDKLLRPDTVELFVQIRKKGYMPATKTKSLLTAMEYTEMKETLISIPRQVKTLVTEDFYKTGMVTPDEITLASVQGDKLGRPMVITNKETFKPGVFQLTVKKAGYNSVIRQVTIPPDDGPFSLPVHLSSKLRNVVYRIQSDFMPIDQKDLEPDEISMNGQPISKNSKVKPGEYKLVIKKEGYEPVVKTVIVVPDEQQFVITEFLRALPRQVIFHITGDYKKGKKLNPDEVSIDGRPIRSGDTVRPDAYRVMVRKKGYHSPPERIIIEPKNEPYILKKEMVSIPRRIDLSITANFPKGKKIFPEVATLGNRNITTDESFKPGDYELTINHGGYEHITKAINIEPDDIPFRIQEVLQAKPVALQLTLTRDIAPEDPSISTKQTLTNERTNDIIPFKSGDTVLPESYLMKIEQAGYEPDLSKHIIFPSENTYNVERRLVASLRGVVTKITAEYPPKQIIVPDTISIDNKPVGKDFKIKPGGHDLVILSEGYMPIRERIEILASPKDYRLVRMLETRPRLTNFIFLDSYNGTVLEPDDIFLRDDKILAGEPQNLKPGKYNLSVRLSGYAAIQEEVEVPVGVGNYEIRKFMVAIKREVLPKVKTDYYGDRLLMLDEVDVFTLDDQAIEGKKDTKDGKIYVKPGKYTAFIQKRGYEPITKKHDIDPDPEAFVIAETLISKLRQLDITIKSSFPFASKEGITPDELKLGAQDVKNGDSIKPGEYALVIRKKGYKHIIEQVQIEPDEKSFTIDRTMETLPRIVRYEVINDYNNQPVEPDVITLDENNLEQDATFLPGKYTLKIEKTGYYPKNQEVLIEPSDEVFLIKVTLVAMDREIELNITGDYPANEIIDPDIAALNGKDVRDYTFKPGTYTFEIQHPGFEALKESIEIEPGEDPLLLERVLVSLPRTLEEALLYDVEPPEELQAHKITLAPAESPNKETVVKNGDKIKPGEYVLRITKEAYEPIEKKKYIWPAEEAVVIDDELIAKQVLLLINITYDVKPPESLPEYSVSLIDRTGIPRLVKHGNRTRPGKYKLKVERPGYAYGAPKEIYILPSEQPYNINEHLVAKSRQLSFDMVDTSIPDRPRMVEAYKIINNATALEVTFRDRFNPGKEIELKVMFKRYKTVRKKFLVEPGEGPYRAQVPLAKLKKFEFSVRHKDKKRPPFIELDGIEYNYQFSIDGQDLEDHHIKAEPGVGKWYYTVSAEVKATNLQAYGGYMFVQRRLGRPGTLPRFNAIDVRKLIAHLEKIRQMPGRGYRGSLEVLELGLRKPQWRRMLKQANREQIEVLMHYLEDWKDVDDALRLRIRVVLDRLEKIKGG